MAAALALHPDGRSLLVSDLEGHVWWVSLAGGKPQTLSGFSSSVRTVAFSPSGRLAAAAAGFVGREDAVIRIWDLETGDVQILDLDDGKPFFQILFASEQELISSSRGGVRRWNLATGSSSGLFEQQRGDIALSPDGKTLLLSPFLRDSEPALVLDLRNGELRELTSHGTGVMTIAFDRTGTLVITGSRDGTLRIGPLTGEEPHLLLGHEAPIEGIATHPDGKWIASGDADAGIRLWPMPEGRPFHTLPYNELLDKLRALTNYRVVADEQSDTGYTLEIGPFPGWQEVPTW